MKSILVRNKKYLLASYVKNLSPDTFVNYESIKSFIAKKKIHADDYTYAIWIDGEIDISCIEHEQDGDLYFSDDWCKKNIPELGNIYDIEREKMNQMNEKIIMDLEENNILYQKEIELLKKQIKINEAIYDQKNKDHKEEINKLKIFYEKHYSKLIKKDNIIAKQEIELLRHEKDAIINQQKQEIARLKTKNKGK